MDGKEVKEVKNIDKTYGEIELSDGGTIYPVYYKWCVEDD